MPKVGVQLPWAVSAPWSRGERWPICAPPGPAAARIAAWRSTPFWFVAAGDGVAVWLFAGGVGEAVELAVGNCVAVVCDETAGDEVGELEGEGVGEGTGAATAVVAERSKTAAPHIAVSARS